MSVGQGLQLQDTGCTRALGLQKPPQTPGWARASCCAGGGWRFGGAWGFEGAPGLQGLPSSTCSCLCPALPSFPGSPDTSLPPPAKTEGKGAKRKPSEEEENGGEELVEKKVCKGFQTV